MSILKPDLEPSLDPLQIETTDGPDSTLIELAVTRLKEEIDKLKTDNSFGKRKRMSISFYSNGDVVDYKKLQPKLKDLGGKTIVSMKAHAEFDEDGNITQKSAKVVRQEIPLNFF